MSKDNPVASLVSDINNHLKEENPIMDEKTRNLLKKIKNNLEQNARETDKEQPKNENLSIHQANAIIKDLEMRLMDGFDIDAYDEMIKYCNENNIELYKMTHLDIIKMFSKTVKWVVKVGDGIHTHIDKRLFDIHTKNGELECDVAEFNLLDMRVDAYGY